ncbi:MAG: polymer-forming cytoskeletal protein [bacterium]|nr:polymer-forming cytoskeletal protein [bacterium]
MESNQPAAAMRPNPTRASQPEASGTTQVAKGSKFRGEITGSSDLVIAGEVDGKLIVKGTVTIQASGYVSGEIKARTVKVGGRVKGNVAGSEMIEILGQGSVQGDVKSPRVVIADGAFFKGKVEMGSEA